LTAAKDAAIGQLREVAKHAPAELPKIGRAFLDDFCLSGCFSTPRYVV
jgi:hypothetical protein